MKRTMTWIFLAVLAVWCLSPASTVMAQSGNWAERFPSKMTPALETALAELEPGATVDVYVVMKDRPSMAELEALVKGVPLAERHAVLARALRDHAAASQAPVRAALAQGALDQRVFKELWIANALRFETTEKELREALALEEVGYAGLVREFPIETYQDLGAPAPAGGLPFYDGFESGGFGPDWTTATSGTGQIRVSTQEDPIGNYHVLMDSTTSGSYGNCTMTLAIDLSGVTNCYLDFMFKEFGDESHAADAVFLSDDGVNFVSVLPLSGGSTYEQKFLDIDDAASANGLSLNSTFHIRFSWYDNYPIPTDGFAFDEIRVEAGDPPPIPPEPNIEKLQAPLCWAKGVDGDGALILNIDSGVEHTHPDLANQIWSNPGEAPYGPNGIDDDGNGYVDDFRGWDFENNDNDPSPSSSHGTSTSGIVCGDGTGGYQTGMAPDATLAIARIGGEANYWEAQQYAILIGARVITSSYSYKWGTHDPDYHMFRHNCEMEMLAGIIHANSLGNQGDQTSSYPIPFNISTPGNCPGPWIHPDQVKGGKTSIMGCAGVNLDESLYTPSGQGPSAWEDMLIYDPNYAHTQNKDYWDYPYGGFGGGQPGLLKPDVCTYTNVRSTTTGGGYTSSFGGTSAATPHLGGALCLLVSGNDKASPRKISQALQTTAEDKGPAGKDLRYGAGKVQVYDALLRLVNHVEFSDPNPALGDTIDMELSGIPNKVFLLAYSQSLGSTYVPGIGTFDLGLPMNILFVIVMPPSGGIVAPMTIPNNPLYSGMTFHVQTALDDRGGNYDQILFSLVETLEIQ